MVPLAKGRAGFGVGPSRVWNLKGFVNDGLTYSERERERIGLLYRTSISLG